MQPIVQPGMQPVATTFFFYMLSGITLLSGVEPILQAAPSGSQAMMLSPWSLSAPAGGDLGQ